MYTNKHCPRCRLKSAISYRVLAGYIFASSRSGQGDLQRINTENVNKSSQSSGSTGDLRIATQRAFVSCVRYLCVSAIYNAIKSMSRARLNESLVCNYPIKDLRKWGFMRLAWLHTCYRDKDRAMREANTVISGSVRTEGMNA